jgi:hypothetical protein
MQNFSSFVPARETYFVFTTVLRSDVVQDVLTSLTVTVETDEIR